MANNWTPQSALAKAVDTAGFLYDPDQDIIYSDMHAWQRVTGYCHLYDEAAPVIISAIIDCEPIRFAHGGKNWMIELWKGQYGIETGAEVGVYNLPAPKSVPLPKVQQIVRSLPGPLANAFRDAANAIDRTAQQAANQAAAAVRTDWLACASDTDRLPITMTLFKNGRKLFQRGPEEHWWLTGFLWGEFSETRELRAEIQIECKDDAMQNALLAAMKALGYVGIQKTPDRIVRFTFDKPHSTQPVSRGLSEGTVQGNNKGLVDQYNAMKKRLNLTSNDPNHIPDAAAQAFINYFNGFQTLKDAFTKVAGAAE